MDDALEKVDFRQEFELTDSKITRILQNLLEFNFHFRQSPEVIDSIFDDVRDPLMEWPCFQKLELEVDYDEIFDYESGTPVGVSNSKLFALLLKETNP